MYADQARHESIVMEVEREARLYIQHLELGLPVPGFTTYQSTAPRSLASDVFLANLTSPAPITL